MRADQTGRRRLLRVAPPHLLAVVIFGLVAAAGGNGITAGVTGIGLPWLIAGLGGVVGSLTILVTALLVSHPPASGAAVPTGSANSAAPAVPVTIARYLMLVAALAAAVAGIMSAPAATHPDRPLVITVTVGLGVALALFALLADGRIRRAGRTA
ncbi:hypothetical protein AB0I61_10905 [Polymorphospora rubra]|uniref:hypothetical protein n=1 Tax=Polymorphospora rubra TaxID=338584 RepID=UPI00340CCEB9